MSSRLDQEREKELQPKRIDHAIAELEKLGYAIAFKNETTIRFEHNGGTITFYPYSGWATGKTIRDTRGLKNLIKQLNHG